MEYRRRSTITLKDEDSCSNGLEKDNTEITDTRSIFLNVIKELAATEVFLKGQKNASS